MEELEGELAAIDIDGIRKALKRLEVNESFETLGVQLNPIGDDTAIFNEMQQWAKNWSQQLRKSTLKDHEAHTATNVTIMKKLEYPLVAVTLTRKQCDKIMSTLLSTSLSKAGYNRNFPRKALHGPKSSNTVSRHSKLNCKNSRNSATMQLACSQVRQKNLQDLDPLTIVKRLALASHHNLGATSSSKLCSRNRP
jgi:hypothetical protein